MIDFIATLLICYGVFALIVEGVFWCGNRPWGKWLIDWKVTFGIAIHENLLPEFVWIWEQRTPPPWSKRR